MEELAGQELARQELARQELARQEQGVGPEWLSMEDILTAIGTHREQVCVLVVAAIVYGHFSVQTMAPTLSTQWLWAQWPELAQRVTYFNTVFAISSICRLLGSVFLLPMVDIWGRYTYILVFTTLSVVTAALSGAAPNFGTFAAARALTALLAAVLPSASTIYSVEMVQMKRRALPSMLIQFAATIYVTYASAVKLALDKLAPHDLGRWRYAQLLFELPTFLPLALLLWSRLETPRFLLANRGNRPAAFQTFVKLYPPGEDALREKLNLASYDRLRPLHSIVKLEGIDEDEHRTDPHPKRDKSRLRAYLRGSFEPLAHMGELFAKPEFRGSTFALIGAWVFQSFAHWGMFTYMTVFFAALGVNANLTTIGCFLFQIPVQAIVFWVMQAEPWGGRIPAMKYTAVACAAASLALAVTMACGVQNHGALTTLSILSCILSGPIWGPLYSYSAERFPTSCRGSAMALFSSANAVSTVVTSFIGSTVIGLGREHLWLFPLVWGVLRLGVSVCCLFLHKEMNNVALEDT